MIDDIERIEKEEAEREERERREAVAREQRTKDLRELLSLPAGRRLLWWLINGQCGLHSGSFSSDALLMAYHEGRRSIGREVMQESQAADRDGYLLMLSEHMGKKDE